MSIVQVFNLTKLNDDKRNYECDKIRKPLNYIFSKEKNTIALQNITIKRKKTWVNPKKRKKEKGN